MKEVYRTEEFSCMRDGLTIRGTRYLPKTPGPYPIAVISHGLIQNEADMRRTAMLFSMLGFAAYIFDFCGALHGISDGKTTEMSVLTEVRDLKAVIAHAKGDRNIDPEKLILVGAGQGGLVSALTAASLKSKVRGLILFSPAFGIADDVRAGDIRFAQFNPERVPKTIPCGKFTLGHCYAYDIMNLNVMEKIADYRGPVLIVGGEEDLFTDITYWKRAYTVWAKESVPPRKDLDLMLVPGAENLFTPEEESIAFRAVRRFLSRRVQVLSLDVYYTGLSRKRLGVLGHEEWITLSGESESPYFTGVLDEGESWSEQFLKLRRVTGREDCFVLKGRDYTGKRCSVRILLSYDGEKYAVSALSTDSEALSFLNAASPDAEIMNMAAGVKLVVYVKRKEM